MSSGTYIKSDPFGATVKRAYLLIKRIDIDKGKAMKFNLLGLPSWTIANAHS